MKYEEHQKFNDWQILFAPTIPISLLMLVVGFKYANVFIGLLLAASLPLIVYLIGFIFKLNFLVDETGIAVRFYPLQFTYKIYAWDSIETCSIEPLNAFKFGGYGLRKTFDGSTAYLMEGKYMIRIVGKNKKKTYISIKNEVEAVAAIRPYFDKLDLPKLTQAVK